MRWIHFTTRLIFPLVLAGGGSMALGLTGDTDMENRLVVLTVDMSREGRKTPPATPEQPAYYVPVVLGYQERGDIVKHYERKPPEEPIVASLVATLEQQGYRIASKEHPPTLTITFEWGTIAPVYLGRRVINSSEMRTIIIGDSAWDVHDRYAGYNEEMLSLVARHYLMVSAFRYQRAASKGHEDVLLWRAHTTTSAWGDYIEGVIKPMIKIASAGFGRGVKPGASWFNARTGTVKLGELRVIDDLPAK